MRFISLLTFFILCFNSCKKDWSVPATVCNPPFADSSQKNPKAALYQTLLDRHVKQGVPGIVLLVRTPDKGLWIGSAGKATIETGEAMLPCHVHNAASVTKMYMAVATMMLVEEGKIKLDAQINTYLDRDLCKKIDNANKVTVRHLMNHTSGIYDYLYEKQQLMEYFNGTENELKTNSILQHIYHKKAEFEPGVRAAYSNSNTVLLALIINKAIGGNHADLITERIIKKLNLHQTFYKNEPGYPSPVGLVKCYLDRYSNNHLENITELANKISKLQIGSNGIFAAPLDFAAFIEAVFAGKLISQNSLEEMMQWKPSNDGRGLYGLGIFRRASPYGSAIGHRGGGIGGVVDVWHYPDKDVTIVWCANYSDFFDTPVSNTMVNFDQEVEKIAFQ